MVAINGKFPGFLILVLAVPASGQIVTNESAKLNTSSNAIISFNSDLIIDGVSIALGAASLILKGNDQILRTSSTISVRELYVDGGGLKTLIGSWTTNNLTLKSGIIFPDFPLMPGKLTYVGVSELDGNGSAYIEGALYQKKTGPQFYPIGINGIYSPLRLSYVNNSDVEIGVTVFQNDTELILPPGIDRSANRRWQITSSAAHFESIVALNGDGILDEEPDQWRVLAADLVNGDAINLGGRHISGFVSSVSKAHSSILTLGKSTNLDLTPPELVADNTNGSLDGSATMEFSARFNEPESSILDVKALYRPISLGGELTEVPMTLIGEDWVAEQAIENAGELGIEYKLEATNEAGHSHLSSLFRGIPLSNVSVPISYSSFGKSASNYSIISLPLELTDNSVSATFDELGPYDKKKWRLFHYENGTARELGADANIQPGEGYWFISKENPGVQIFSGEGRTVYTTSDDPFEIILTPGWNQIGNPYNFNLSWSDILDVNPGYADLAGPSAQLWTFREGNYSNANVLRRGEGGFVFLGSSLGFAFKFPVVNRNISAGRSGETVQPVLRSPIDAANWEVRLNLRQHDWQLTPIAGFGMRREASEDLDVFDMMTLPRFLDFLELNHSKKYFNNYLANDIVPTSDQYTWSFSVESNDKEAPVNMDWDNHYFGHNERGLLLIDENSNVAVDMRLAQNYIFKPPGKFKVVYGSNPVLEDVLGSQRPAIVSIFPNPARQYAKIQLSIPQAQRVVIELINGLGQSAAEVFSGELPAGTHILSWPGLPKEKKVAGSYTLLLRYRGGVHSYRFILN